MSDHEGRGTQGLGDPTRLGPGSSESSRGPGAAAPFQWDAGLVGRVPEWEILRRFVLNIPGSTAGSVLLRGDAGIGKTRLLLEARALAHRKNIRVLSATCGDQDLTVPFSPWIEMLRQFVSESSKERVYATVSPFRAAIFKLLPELARKAWLYSPDSVEAVALEHRSFLKASSGFFVELARPGGLLLTIDDLGWSDSSTLELLLTILRQSRGHPLAVLATVREEHMGANAPVRETLLAIERQGLARSMTLKGLSDAEVTRLACDVLRRPELGTSFGEYLSRKSGGNPFFLREILQAMADRGELVPTRDGWEGGPLREPTLPLSIVATLQDRLDRLEHDTLATLRVASLIGSEIPSDVLERASELGGEPLLHALEAANRAGVLEERRAGSGPLTYAFSHPLFQEVLAHGMSLARSRRTHLRIAHAIEELAGATREERSATLAYHYLRGDDSGQALRYSVLAGDRAAGVFARSEAVGHYSTALRLLAPSGGPRLRAEVHEKLGDQLIALGRTKEAIEHFKAAATEYEAAHLPAAAGESLVKTNEPLDLPPADRSELMARAATLLKGAPESLGWIHWLEGDSIEMLSAGDPTRAVARLEEALGIARRIGADREEVQCIMDLAYTRPIGSVAAWRADLDRADQIVRDRGLPTLAHYVAFQWAVFARNGEGDIRRSLALLEAGIRKAREEDNPERESLWRGYLRPACDLRLGDFRHAIECADELDEYRLSRGRSRTFEPLAIRAAAAVAMGDWTLADQLVTHITELEMMSDYYWTAELLTLRGSLALAREEYTSASQLLAEARSNWIARGPPCGNVLHYLEMVPSLVRSSVGSGDVDGAGRFAEEAVEIAARFGAPPGVALAARARAEWLLARGDAPAAVTLLSGMVPTLEKYGWLYQAAGAWGSLGQAHSRAGQPDAAALARKRAVALLANMSAGPDVARIRALPNGS